MKERGCRFGEQLGLAGVVTEPDGAPRGAVVLVTAGLVPKFGPFRLYTELARRLAEEGLVVLRFDLGGVGDSQQARHDTPLKDRTAHDVSDAIDWLATHHDVPELVLGGLCSGAEDSFRGAEHDTRVSGVVMVDPFAYRTPGFLPRHTLHRVVRRTRRALGLYRPVPAPRLTDKGGSGRVVSYEYMSRDESSRILRTLVERRAHVHFVYTGGASEVFNHPGQLRAMFSDVPFDGMVTVDHFPELEHTQMLSADRDILVEAVARRLGWMTRTPRKNDERRDRLQRPVHQPAGPRIA